MLGLCVFACLCIFASHWLVAEPAAFEGLLTGVLISSGT